MNRRLVLKAGAVLAATPLFAQTVPDRGLTRTRDVPGFWPWTPWFLRAPALFRSGVRCPV